MTGINIDGDAAHDAAQRELTKPVYPRPSLTDRLMGWFDELLFKAFVDSDWLPGGWITVGLLAAVLLAAVVVAVRVARRTLRTRRDGGAALLVDTARTAAEDRRAAQTAAERGDWVQAIRYRLRAVARTLEETGALDAVPGRTATELARAAAAALPDLTAEFRVAADTFNAVSYGAQAGTESEYRQIAALDARLSGVPSR